MTLRERINETLQALGEEELTGFQWQLQQPNLAGQKPIKRAIMEKNKTTMQTADLIVSSYAGKAEQMMVIVLEKIQKPELVEEFQKGGSVMLDSAGAVPPLRTSTGSGVTDAEAIQFVDDHMDDLVQRVNMVKPIADLLLTKKVIQREVYEEVMAPTTNMGKMRELYKLLTSPEAKVIFYNGLEKHENFLLKNLMKNYCKKGGNLGSSDEVDHSNRKRARDREEASGITNNDTFSGSEQKEQQRTCEDEPLPKEPAVAGLDTLPPEPEREDYKMDSDPRGCCLILENEKFQSKKDRDGTEQDSRKLAAVFSWLGFTVNKCKDKTKAQMVEVLEFFAKPASSQVQLDAEQWSVSDKKFNSIQLKHPPVHGNCFVCCILSHGGEDGVCGTDGASLSSRDIMSLFKGNEYSALLAKPKVFFFQACRGEEIQERAAVPVLDGDEDAPDYLPVYADFLLGFATIHQCPALRHPDAGTWYIQTLCEELENGCPRGDDILKILTRVNDVVCRKEERLEHPRNSGRFVNFKQSPGFESYLRKQLIFHPLNTQPSSGGV